jgi:putative Mg2+ transporter-C (MgtC) family protein
MTFGEAVLRLGAATLAGGIIGLNRDLHGKSAGVRTHALVGLGSAVATLVASSAFGERPDPAAASRVIQGIITGIGFLGAGVILHRDGSHSVRGLTTAASIWVVAALGVACGTAEWPTAIVGTVLTLIVLLLGGPFERFVRRLRGERDEGSTLRSSPPGD